jgi:hypothetical protein
VLGELVLTFLFVFIGVAAAMAAGTHQPSPISRHLILQQSFLCWPLDTRREGSVALMNIGR